MGVGNCRGIVYTFILEIEINAILMKVKRITHVFWDWNGTLLDDAKYCSNIINKILTKYNLPNISYIGYRKMFRFPVQNFYDKLGLANKGVSFEETSHEFINHYQDNWKSCYLQPNATKVLRLIHNFGIEQSVITAGKQSLIIDYVTHYRLNRYFCSLNGTRDITASGKIGIAQKYLDSLNIDGDKVLIVGDTVHDYEVAKCLGCSVILYDRGHNQGDRFDSCNAIVVNDLMQILDFI